MLTILLPPDDEPDQARLKAVQAELDQVENWLLLRPIPYPTYPDGATLEKRRRIRRVDKKEYAAKVELAKMLRSARDYLEGKLTNQWHEGSKAKLLDSLGWSKKYRKKLAELVEKDAIQIQPVTVPGKRPWVRWRILDEQAARNPFPLGGE